MKKKFFIESDFLKKIFLNLSVFTIIVTIFINFTHNQIPSEVKVANNNIGIKTTVSQDLASKETYEFFLNRDCEITGHMKDRHKVRWVFNTILFNVYDNLINFNNVLPYYFNILFFSSIIFLSYLIIFRTFEVKKEYKFLFLFFIAFVFQNVLSEYQYSIFEMLFLSLALYASKNKNFLQFLIWVILATLNRESGILISLTWLIFNKEIKQTIIAIGLSLFVLFSLNFDIFACLLNPKFFLPLENEPGQFNFSDIFSNKNYLSTVKVIMINFIIPFGFCFYFHFKTENKNKMIFYILILYLFMFLIALPLDHLAPRIILLPILMTLIYFYEKNKVSSI